MPVPEVIFADEALPRFKQGWDTIANVLAVTLGPRTGYVLHTMEGRDNEVKHLLDAATIARRIIELPGGAENVGGMTLRHMAWRMHEEIGDGAATMAVLGQSLFDEGFRMITAGANAMILRRGIDRGTQAAVEALRKMSLPVEGEERLAQLATALAGNDKLGRVLGEMLDILGPNGAIVVEEYMGPYLDRQYIEGSRYADGGYSSPHFITDVTKRQVSHDNVRILITDKDVERTEEVLHLLEQLAERDKTPFVVIAREVKGPALSVMVVNHKRNKVPCLGINFKPYFQRQETLDDLALLTGGRVFRREAELDLAGATLDDLGAARHISAFADQFTIVGGAGDAAAIRDRIRAVRSFLAETDDDNEKYGLRQRLGNLTGGVGVLKFGTFSKEDRKLQKEELNRIVQVLSAAMEEGIVPGGGAAYLDCIPALRELEADGDEAIGIDIVARALEAPMKRIAQNAKLHPPIVIAEAQRHGPGFGYDVAAERVVDMEEAGIMDPVRVLRSALEIASSGACMALTAGAIVLHREPKESMQP